MQPFQARRCRRSGASLYAFVVRAAILVAVVLVSVGVSAAPERVRLEGHVAPSLARATPEAHAAAPEAPLILTIVLKRTDQAGFEAFLRDVHDPATPAFGRYLTQAEIARRFGPSADAYESTRAWLEREGFRVLAGSANRLTLTVEGPLWAVERSFAVKFGRYRHGERSFRAADRDPALPGDIAPYVDAVIGLSDLARPVRVRSLSNIQELQNGDYESPVENLAYTCWLVEQIELAEDSQQVREILAGLLGIALTGSFEFELSAMSPVVTMLNYMCAADELNMLNRLAAGLDNDNGLQDPGSGAAANGPVAPKGKKRVSAAGAGQKIGLLEFDNFNLSDVQDYLALVGHSDRIAQLSQVHVAGGAGTPGPDQSEVLLDINAVMSLAPGAQVVVYDGPFNGRGSFQTMFNAMIGDGVTVISNSWAYCEDQTTLADVNSIESILASAAASGITVVSGSGDSGSTCLDGSPNVVHVPASSPHVTAVGGTSSQRGVGGTWGSETWWDGTKGAVHGGQGGFGVSKFFARPAYQNGLNASAMRSIPDVALPADPVHGYLICQASAGGCPTRLLYGGTSVAAPLLAAMVAVLNDQTAQPLGFLNAKFYPLANTSSFHTSAQLDFAHVGLGVPNIGQLFLALTNTTPGPFDTTKSALGAFPPVVTANGTTKGGIAVVLRDSAFNPVSGQTVQLTMNAGSHAVVTAVNAVSNIDNGVARFTVTNTVPETVTFTATVAGQTLAQNPTIRFISPPASAGSIAAAPLTVPADGNSQSTVTVTLVDGQGNPSTGKTVTLAQGNGSAMITALNATTDGTGKARFTAADFKTESVTFTAVDVTDGNLPVPGSVQVAFVSGGTPGCNIGLGTPGGGYAASTFVSSVPYDWYTCIGPIGVAFAPNGELLVASNLTGDIYRFGSQGGSATAATLWSTALRSSGPLALLFTPSGQLFAAQRYPDPGRVVELDPATGAIQRTVATISSPIDLKMDPLSGDLFVSNFDGVQRISNFANGPGTVAPYYSALFTDGMAFGADGTLYVKSGCCDAFVARVNGTNTMNPGAFTVAATVPNGDGIGIEQNPNNPGQPTLYVNRTDGIITRVDLSQNPPTQSNIYTNGSRGDFVAVGPDGCFYATQSDRVIKLTKSDASCSLTPTTIFPTIVLTPAVAPNPVQGSSTSFTATLQNVQNSAGTPITLIISGVNGGLRLVNADASGVATFQYQGVHAGVDRVLAFAKIDGLPVNSNLGAANWTTGNHVTYLGLGASPSSAQPYAPLTLRARLVDVAGQPAAGLAGMNVDFSVAGKNCSGVTDMTGLASCVLTPESPTGPYTVSASFSGMGPYLPASATAELTLIAGPLLDIDNNGQYDATTDGVLLIRYLFGMRGPALTANALGENARRTDPDEIAAYLNNAGFALDIDGNQQIDALTDGLLAFRYLLGLRGQPLLDKVLGPGASRQNSNDVENFIEMLKPAN